MNGAIPLLFTPFIFQHPFQHESGTALCVQWTHLHPVSCFCSLSLPSFPSSCMTVPKMFLSCISLSMFDILPVSDSVCLPCAPSYFRAGLGNASPCFTHSNLISLSIKHLFEIDAREHIQFCLHFRLTTNLIVSYSNRDIKESTLFDV